MCKQLGMLIPTPPINQPNLPTHLGQPNSPSFSQVQSMLTEPLRTHKVQFFSSPSDLMKSTIVDESLSSTTKVPFQRRVYLLLVPTSPRISLQVIQVHTRQITHCIELTSSIVPFLCTRVAITLMSSSVTLKTLRRCLQMRWLMIICSFRMIRSLWYTMTMLRWAVLTNDCLNYVLYQGNTFW